MAIIAVIAQILLVLSALSLVHLAYTKMPQIRLVDPLSSPERRDASMKHQLFAKRLERDTGQVAATVGGVLSMPWRLLRNAFRRFAGRLIALERRYEHSRRASGSKEERTNAAQALVQEAEAILKKGDAVIAEKKLVEAVTLAPKFAPAYVALGYLYAEKRSLEEAKEAFSFAASLEKNDPTAPYALADMLDKAGRIAEALTWYKKALVIEPNSPRYLSSVIESALALKDVATAEDALTTLSEVNPQNKKIRDYAAALERLLEESPKKQ